MWMNGEVIVVPFINIRNIGKKPGCVGEKQGIYSGQNGVWELRKPEILAFYLETDVLAMET